MPFTALRKADEALRKADEAARAEVLMRAAGIFETPALPPAPAGPEDDLVKQAESFLWSFMDQDVQIPTEPSSARELPSELPSPSRQPADTLPPMQERPAKSLVEQCLDSVPSDSKLPELPDERSSGSLSPCVPSPERASPHVAPDGAAKPLLEACYDLLPSADRRPGEPASEPPSEPPGALPSALPSAGASTGPATREAPAQPATSKKPPKAKACPKAQIRAREEAGLRPCKHG